MLLQYSLVCFLSSIPFCFGQDGTPTMTALADGLGVLAIVPTTTGQIGINPVDIPPPESFYATIGVDSEYLTEVVTSQSTSTKWIGASSDFGTATVTTTDQDGTPKETVIPQGFRVIINDEGKLEITLSQWFKDQLLDIVSSVQSCPIQVRRDWDSRRHQHVETRAINISCLRRRISRIAQRLGQHPEVTRQFELMNEQVAYATGNDVVALAESEQMVPFAEQDIVVEIMEAVEVEAELAEDVDLLASLGSEFMGVLGSLAFFIGTATILEDLWKLRANPQPPMPFYRVQDDSCPERELACAGTRCKGENGKCTAKWKGCKCVISGRGVGDSFYFGSEWASVEDEIQQFVFGSDPDTTKSIPQPSCTSSNTEDRNLANVESNIWSQLLDSFCEDNPKLSRDIHETKKTSDLGLDSYEGWTFDFALETTAENNCSSYSCVDVFGKFTQCTYGSHTKYKTGKLELDCGTAKYAMNEPDSEDDTPDEEPKTALEMQNAKCYGADDFGDHGDIQESSVRGYSGWACAGTALKTIKAGEEDSFRTFYTVTNDVPYQFNIYWKDGCELETGQTEMYASNPLDEENSGHTRCQEIFIDNYKRCINGGVGGSNQAGCLVYEFKAEKRDD
ncbi:hypothetical protein EDB81DRAFT_942360 [Dactylonectria macrodidyma]|uniref:Uncharacterized protein n=1 Tax=Dactylonectria macrodidyma TaxID=307937 RepID=A0A9P9FKX1_9HYPO|nr:hypothetical protein EDB81DRAFT_942360 [Dactylonectria macrodidyma]